MMKNSVFPSIPENLKALEEETKKSGFSMPSERETGSFLQTLAASKPNGHFLELGTGTGLSTAWILSGMNDSATLETVDNEKSVQEIARKHLGHDLRINFHRCDGKEFIEKAKPESFDFIFADAWPGKYTLLDETLILLKIGGVYIIDDMSPQPNWPDGHHQNVTQLLEKLKSYDHLSVTQMNWATGIVIAARLT